MKQRFKGITGWLVPGQIWAAVLALAGAPLYAADIPQASDLQADGRQSAQTGRPVLIFFSMDTCPYCEVVHDLYLQPMYNDETSRERVLMRVVKVGGYGRLRGFDGKHTTHGGFAKQQGVSFTPTIRFYDSDGRELAPQVYGYTSPDFYGSILEAAITSAGDALRSRQARIGKDSR